MVSQTGVRIQRVFVILNFARSAAIIFLANLWNNVTKKKFRV